MTGKKSINHINKKPCWSKEEKCALSFNLVFAVCDSNRPNSAYVCVCVYQVEGCLEMTELHTCLWLWSAYGKHSKSEGNRKYPPSDTNKFNKRRSLSRHLGAFPRRKRKKKIHQQVAHFPFQVPIFLQIPSAQSNERKTDLWLDGRLPAQLESRQVMFSPSASKVK